MVSGCKSLLNIFFFLLWSIHLKTEGKKNQYFLSEKLVFSASSFSLSAPLAFRGRFAYTCSPWKGLYMCGSVSELSENWIVQLWELVEQSLWGCCLHVWYWSGKSTRQAVRQGRLWKAGTQKHKLEIHKELKPLSCRLWPWWQGYPAEACALHYKAKRVPDPGVREEEGGSMRM